MSTISSSYFNSYATATQTEKSKEKDKTEKKNGANEVKESDKKGKADKKGKTETGKAEGNFGSLDSANSATSATNAGSAGSAGSYGSAGSLNISGLTGCSVSIGSVDSVDSQREHMKDQFSAYYEQDLSYGRLESAYEKLMQQALSVGDTVSYNEYKALLDDVNKKRDEHRGTMSNSDARLYEHKYGINPYKEWSDSRF